MKKRIITSVAVIAYAFILIYFSDIVSNTTFVSMKNTVFNIIPSLFPYMVISSLIISSGTADIMGRFLPISKIFGLPPCASASIIIGAMCGFPLGASSAVEMYKNGYITKKQAEVLISTANITGPSFIIFVIGSIIWKNKLFGIYMYVCQLLAVALASLFVNRILFPIKQSNAPIKAVILTKPLLSGLSEAIRDAALSSLTVCGFITFFSVIIEVIKTKLTFIPYNVFAVLASVLEFSESARISSHLRLPYGAFICGFAIGWSGISVLCQTAYFTSEYEISLKRYITVKFIEGILLGTAGIIYAHIYGLEQTNSSITVFNEVISNKNLALLVILIIICIVCSGKKKKYA